MTNDDKKYTHDINESITECLMKYENVKMYENVARDTEYNFIVPHWSSIPPAVREEIYGMSRTFDARGCGGCQFGEWFGYRIYLYLLELATQLGGDFTFDEFEYQTFI
jgi:hypothetical protein